MALEEDEDNKLPLKDRTCNDEDTDLNITTDTRDEQRRENLLKWMKRLTIALIILIGFFLIGYMLWKLTFSDANEPKLVEDVQIESIGSFNGGLQGDAILIPDTTTLDPMEDDEGKTEESTEISPKTLLDSQTVLGVYKDAAVCSDSSECSAAGSDMLRRGGSVIDAALAVLLCNGIVTMQSMGIGGGFLMNVFIQRENRAYTIDARDVAPFAAHEDMFVGKPLASKHSPLAIAVPGEVMGYYKAHSRFGSLPWKMIMQPSINICSGGYIMSEHQYNSLKSRENVTKDALLSATFVNKATGDFHPIGTRIFPPHTLCETYLKLSENGPLDFYNGTLAKLIAADLRDLGSIVTADDLEAYNADVVSSISMPLGGDTLYAVPPVGSGTIVAHIMSILNGYNFNKNSIGLDETTALTFHRIIEAMKYGYAKRWELGDLRFHDIRELVSQLTSIEYGEEIRQHINDTGVHKDIRSYGAKFTAKEEVGTSHMSLIAPNGDAVSVTSTVNNYFGSGYTGKRTGIIFNSGMDDFSTPGISNQFDLPPSPTNFIEPQKRPMSSMSPMIVTNSTGHVVLVIGSAGGAKIIAAVAQVMIRVLWFGEDIKQALDAPRIYHQLVPNILEYDNESLDGIMRLLEAKGHKVKRFTGGGSAMCGIAKNSTAIYANADFRKQGGVFGF